MKPTDKKFWVIVAGIWAIYFGALSLMHLMGWF